MTIQEELAKYHSGRLVECKILSKASDGYFVAMGGKNLPGVLPTSHEHELGTVVLAQFIEVHEDRAVLHELSNKRSSYERLRDALKEEQALTASLKFKRATDLLVPPVDDVEIRALNSSEIDFAKLCQELEKEEFTGCIKSFNQERFSRSGAILNGGRVVGCIYGNKSTTEALPVKESLELMLADAFAKGAEIRVYELPEDVVMALAALFLGCPLMRSDSLKPEEYVVEMRHWVRQHKQTACFACSLQTTTWLDLYHDGDYAGTFCVEDQKFYRSEKFLLQRLNEPNARVEMALLSPELSGDQKAVGLPLMATK
ncbi:MAG: hypothetical protein K2W95_24940 [Candidatus Obscuribacterales bacterium]|nr:hypothetical protein [Candidatus Obscuribacterales bacterium]